jgi:hypothetical protein
MFHFSQHCIHSLQGKENERELPEERRQQKILISGTQSEGTCRVCAINQVPRNASIAMQPPVFRPGTI